MGELKLNDIGYSNTDTGVLMLNGINYTGGGSGGGGGGGISLDTIVKGGQICSASRGGYEVTTFGSIADYKYLVAKVYSTVGGETYTDTLLLDAQKVVAIGTYNFTGVMSNTSGVPKTNTKYSMNETSFTLTEYYDPSWWDIFVDIYGTTEELFPA